MLSVAPAELIEARRQACTSRAVGGAIILGLAAASRVGSLIRLQQLPRRSRLCARRRGERSRKDQGQPASHYLSPKWLSIQRTVGSQGRRDTAKQVIIIIRWGLADATCANRLRLGINLVPQHLQSVIGILLALKAKPPSQLQLFASVAIAALINIEVRKRLLAKNARRAQTENSSGESEAVAHPADVGGLPAAVERTAP